MKVYIAAPLTKGDHNANIRAAVHAADIVLRHRHLPFLPHTMTHFWDLISPRPYEDWMSFDFAWLFHCDAVLRVPGDSPGADREVAEALRQGKRVFYGVDEFVSFCHKEGS